MTTRASVGWWVPLASITYAVGACAPASRIRQPLSPVRSSESTVATFQRMADSTYSVHGDSATADRYSSVAAVLRRVPGFDTVTMVINGTIRNFEAIAIVMVDSAGSASCPASLASEDRGPIDGCSRRSSSPRLRYTLFAWVPGQPRQMIELVAWSDSATFGASSGGSRESGYSAESDGSAPRRIPVSASLTYFSRRGIEWQATSGSQHSVVSPSVRACSTPVDRDSPSDRQVIVMRGEAGVNGSRVSAAPCRLATFIFDFSGTIAAPSGAWGIDTTAGPHVTWMAPMHVRGAYVMASVARIPR
jgi:hypothetical protein